MANFSAAQSISVTGLCANLVSTDTTDYLTNVEGITISDVIGKTWNFKNSSGTTVKTVTTNNTVSSASCPITLLSINMSVELYITVNKDGTENVFSVRNNILIGCLGV